jgi:hypothetical protein
MQFHLLNFVQNLNPVNCIVVHPAVNQSLAIVHASERLFGEEVFFLLEKGLKIRKGVIVLFQDVFNELLDDSFAVITFLQTVVQSAEEILFFDELVFYEDFADLSFQVINLIIEGLESFAGFLLFLL